VLIAVWMLLGALVALGFAAGSSWIAATGAGIAAGVSLSGSI